MTTQTESQSRFWVDLQITQACRLELEGPTREAAVEQALTLANSNSDLMQKAHGGSREIAVISCVEAEVTDGGT